ncbi:hypothetical protein FGO68_gene7306 [Halteria grandinella]|uniref:Uncharacterized protein n=1 Tax=Halteria grandinella TaxID=5974 RepID=A0A8J8SX18_HALGN|nr:hypothetical protein FGO68_gene7306 [Halteria grandinella]
MQGDLIQATLFRDAVEYYGPKIKEGHVLLMSNGHVKTANKKFTNISNEFSLTFDKHSIIKDLTAEEDPSAAIDEPEVEVKIKEKSENYVKIEDLHTNFDGNTQKHWNIKALLLELGCTQTIQLKNGEMKTRTSLIIGDDSKYSVLCCIWGRDIRLQQLNPSFPTVVNLKRVKVSTFGVFSLNANEDCIVEENPDEDAAHRMRKWYLENSKKFKYDCLSMITDQQANACGLRCQAVDPKDIRNMNEINGERIYVKQPLKKEEQKVPKSKCEEFLSGPAHSKSNEEQKGDNIKEKKVKPKKFKLAIEFIQHLCLEVPRQLFRNPELIYKEGCLYHTYTFHTLAYLYSVKSDSPWIKCCPISTCSRKLTETNKGFQCKNCMKYYSNYVPQYHLIAIFADFTDCFQVTLHRQTAEQILGVSAHDFTRMSEQSKNFLLTEKRRFKLFALQIDASYQQVTTTNKLTFTCRKVYQGDQWQVVNKYLIEELQQYRNLYYASSVALMQTDINPDQQDYSYDEYNHIVLGDIKEYAEKPLIPQQQQSELCYTQARGSRVSNEESREIDRLLLECMEDLNFEDNVNVRQEDQNNTPPQNIYQPESQEDEEMNQVEQVEEKESPKASQQPQKQYPPRTGYSARVNLEKAKQSLEQYVAANSQATHSQRRSSSKNFDYYEYQ